ncbi:alpha/beta hydrolase [Frateuria defendens]|uniref:alpha/beta hydrolase n=1 Tax=Frateuria defendens TaxID=2219559 RepID=UPI00069CE9DD|nr:alpha/beta hydrolase [Frateuria defendens]
MNMLRGIGCVLLAWLLPASFVFAQALPAAPRLDGASAQTVLLWPGQPPGSPGPGPSGPEQGGDSDGDVLGGAVFNVTRPRMVVYRPVRANGTAVLLIGGGGYVRIGIGHESMTTAQWLARQGVTPVVLYYRLPGDGWPPAAPFQDAQRAMRLLRARAAELGLDPHRLGVLGFSAGGNLAGITATRHAHAFYAPVDAADRLPSRPDFAGLIYPVISLQPPFDTTRSSRELGRQADAATAYSVDLHVGRDTSPTFLAHAADDPIAAVDNSLRMFDALRRQGVAAELHVFERGGHGWGMGRPGTPVAAWPGLFAAWARGHGFMAAGD